MLDILKQNKIIIIVLVVVIAAFAWFGLSDRQPVASSSLLTNESRGTASAAEQEILRLLLDMRSIRLDSAIFENPAFASLRDFGRSIVPEPVGRTNPFEPARTIFGPATNNESSNSQLAQ